jgi:hypothetical protein
MYCPKCGTLNQVQYRFCLKCGTPLPESTPSISSIESDTTASQISQVDLEHAATIDLPQPIYSPEEVVEPMMDAQPNQVLPLQDPYSRSISSAKQPQQYTGVSGNGTKPYQAPALPQVNISALHIWGPFAGYGGRRRHIGWLLDNRGDQVESLNQKINQQFSERSIPGTAVSQQSLKGRGVLVENRTYFLLRKGLVTMGLYVSKFGKDLYLSLVSYLKPPVSNLRVVILGAMVLFWLYIITGFSSALNNSLTNFINSTLSSMGSVLYGGNVASPNAGGLAFLLCVIGPLGLVVSILLFLFAAYSLWKFLTEKDILAGLRVSPNEFNEDDLMALEKAVEQTINQSMDEIGLDFKLARETSVTEGRII